MAIVGARHAEFTNNTRERIFTQPATDAGERLAALLVERARQATFPVFGCIPGPSGSIVRVRRSAARQLENGGGQKEQAEAEAKNVTDSFHFGTTTTSPSRISSFCESFKMLATE